MLPGWVPLDVTHCRCLFPIVNLYLVRLVICSHIYTVADGPDRTLVVHPAHPTRVPDIRWTLPLLVTTFGLLQTIPHGAVTTPFDCIPVYYG